MWKNIQINIQNVETRTEKATLIKMPNKSKYAGYKFWHTNKLVREGKNSYALSIGYTDDFKFKLKKFGNGQWNRFSVIDEIEIDATEFEECFDVMDDNIKSQTNYVEVEHHVPETKKVVKVEVDDELKY